MAVDFLLDRFAQAGEKTAFIWEDRAFTYTWFGRRVERWLERLQQEEISAGSAVVLHSDFPPSGIALLLALFAGRCIVIPLSSGAAVENSEQVFAIAQAGFRIEMDGDDLHVHRAGRPGSHPLYDRLRSQGAGGLVLFTSGSSGEPKAAVHDLSRFLEKFRVRRHDLRTLAFMLVDHVGGLDTLFYCLSNLSTLVLAPDRTPAAVCRLIERYRVEVLPVTPTFLSLLLLSEAHRSFDLSSLRCITYGAEVMPASLLQRTAREFPDVRLLQKYGTTELGTLRSRSKASDSTWVRIGGEGYETRVRNGILQIKTGASMLGYLNAPFPLTPDGWFDTRDRVEEDGEYLRFLGRDSDVINVGGEKVYPSEVESVILQMEGVLDVMVYAENNALTGQIVCAQVQLRSGCEPDQFEEALYRHCVDRLEKFKLPVKVQAVSEGLASPRSKKNRRPQGN